MLVCSLLDQNQLTGSIPSSLGSNSRLVLLYDVPPVSSLSIDASEPVLTLLPLQHVVDELFDGNHSQYLGHQAGIAVCLISALHATDLL
jgi:hypothetical protein